jgi:radical SAM protein with 4Fe4S-binding SPASM domain
MVILVGIALKEEGIMVSRYIFRKEYFGGLLYDRATNQLRIINHAGVKTLELLATYDVEFSEIVPQVPERLREDLVTFYNEVQELELLQDREVIETLSQSCTVPDGLLSAPIQVYLFVTQRCNLKCKHCFVNADTRDTEGLTLFQLEGLLDQLRELKVPCIAVSGGEPFIRQDIIDILKAINDRGFALNITTNGTLLTPSIVQRIVDEGIKFRFVYVSIEGPKEVHEFIRGPHSFQRAIEGLKMLHKAGIKAGITATLNGLNIRRIAELEELALTLDAPLGISLIKASGRAINYMGDLFQFSIQDLAIAREEINEMRNNRDVFIYCGELEDITSEDIALLTQLDVAKCGAGISTASVMHDGTVMSCPYMSDYFDDQGIRRGNVLESSFRDIWMDSPEFRYVRTFRLNETCSQCSRYRVDCMGGCPANAYQFWGDPMEIDPLCMLHGSIPRHTLLSASLRKNHTTRDAIDVSLASEERPSGCEES